MSEYKKNVNIDFTESPTANISNYKTETIVKQVKTGKRHVIKVNDINLYRNKYAAKSKITTKNLITNPARSIAIFCNEYIPTHFPEGKYIQYYFTINGTNYEVVPINSDREGIKIIKVSDYDFKSEYVKYINQKIISAYLTIIINTPNDYETPFISDLKVLVGDKNV